MFYVRLNDNATFNTYYKCTTNFTKYIINKKSMLYNSRIHIIIYKPISNSFILFLEYSSNHYLVKLSEKKNNLTLIELKECANRI